MDHELKTARIAQALKKRRSKDKVIFTKKAVSHQVPKVGAVMKGDDLDLSDFDEILEIDKKAMTCTAEPGVTFSDLVKETLNYGLVPYLVPELKGITIGGAVVGCSVESMSYKYGGFHDNCLEYELIDAKGNILLCSPKKNKKLFNMVHGTFGTLGILTRLKFKLLPAKKYVHLKYEKYKTLDTYKKAIENNYKKKSVDFMDGLIHSPELFVLVIGNFTDQASYTHSYEWKYPFYKATKKRDEDYMTVYDYFFRYDSDCHWIARNYGLENPILRFLFGKLFLGSTKMLKLARKTSFLLKKKRPDVIVDVFVPFSRIENFFEFYKTQLGDFPVWVVPYQIPELYPWINAKHFSKVKDKLFIDLAIYGMKQKGDKNYYRILEEALLKLPGIKTLISHNFYSEKEFWSVWNKKNYLELKKLTDPDNIFNDIYNKMCPKK